MRRLMRGAVVAATGMLLAAGGGMGTAVAYDDGRVPLSPILRNCDHGVRSYFAPSGTATAYAIVTRSGGAVTADITMATADRNTAYQVKLIQLPRAASVPCNPGDPGVTGGVLHTDFAGGGHLTLTEGHMPDGTGAWVEISRPAPHSLVPVEYYTSDVVSRF